MKHIVLSSVLLACLCLSFSCKEKKEAVLKNDWVRIFNGKDLNDWIVKIKGHPAGDNYKNTFIVEGDILKVNYKKYNDSFNASYGHIFYKKPFSNYKFRMDYRFTGSQLADGAGWANRNSGIMVHCEDPNGIGLNQNFPVCIEVQLLGGNGIDERSTGNLCTPGTHVTYNDTLTTQHIVNSSSKTYHNEQWVHVEIEVRNDSIIKHFINGEEVLRYTKPHYGGPVNYNETIWKAKKGKPLKSGYISLQSESHPVEFKNIELLKLD